MQASPGQHLQHQQAQTQVMPMLEVLKPPAAVQIPALPMQLPSPLPDIQPLSTSGAEAMLQSIFKPKFTDVTLEQLRKAQQLFASERDWDQVGGHALAC